MKTFRRTTLITVGCISVLTGIGLAKLAYLQISDIFFFGLPLLLLLKNKSITSLIVVVILGLGLGLWRGSVYVNKLDEIKQNLGKQLSISALVTSDAIYGNNQQLEFTASRVVNLQTNQPIAGSFKIAGFGPNMVYRGDKISVTGKLYLTRGANQGGISFAQINVLGEDSGIMNRLTRKFSAGMQSSLPEPESSFGLGLLIGQRSGLSKDITNSLTTVGLVHIVAVSGYNLTILVRAIGKLRLGSKYQKLVLSLGFILAFILVTGFSASIVRAAIISSLSLLAWYYGRTIKPLLLIFFTAALTGLYNPFYVWSDIGWYLSFLAFFGILIVAPLITERFIKRPLKLVGQVTSETLSAQLMTLPLIMYIFGQVSVIAPLANLLVVPLVPVAMLLCTVAMIFGTYLPAIAGWFAWPAKQVLLYMLDISHILSNISLSSIKIAITAKDLTVIYVAIIFVLIVMKYKMRQTKNTLSSA